MMFLWFSSNTTGATSETQKADPSRVYAFIPGIRGVIVAQSLISHVVLLSTIVCLFVIFLLTLQCQSLLYLRLLITNLISSTFFLYEQKSFKFWRKILRAPFRTCCLREW